MAVARRVPNRERVNSAAQSGHRAHKQQLVRGERLARALGEHAARKRHSRQRRDPLRVGLALQLSLRAPLRRLEALEDDQRLAPRLRRQDALDEQLALLTLRRRP